jgi:hypothetical protein
MQAVCGLLALVYLGVVVWLGFAQSPIWTPAVAALVGFLLYLGVRPGAVRIFQRDGFVRAFCTIYLTQVLTAFVPFGIGWAIGAATG